MIKFAENWMKFFVSLAGLWLLLFGIGAFFAGLRLFNRLFIYDAVLSIFFMFVGVFFIWFSIKTIKKAFKTPNDLVGKYQKNRKNILISFTVQLAMTVLTRFAFYTGFYIPTIVLLPLFAGYEFGAFLLQQVNIFLAFGFTASYFPEVAKISQGFFGIAPFIAQFIFVYVIVESINRKRNKLT